MKICSDREFFPILCDAFSTVEMMFQAADLVSLRGKGNFSHMTVTVQYLIMHMVILHKSHTA
jgi:hypothetical protein